jgi:NAD(P)-dependent dehydrogenase (short-subunit alcohol dehydrogenase family)
LIDLVDNLDGVTDVPSLSKLVPPNNPAWDCYKRRVLRLPQQGRRPMARELEGKVAVVTGAGSGIGLASTEAMLAAGSRVVMVDRDEAALKALCNKHGDTVIPLVIDLLDSKDCATLLPRALAKAGQLDILHANAGTYIGGDLVDADTGAIDRMLNLNVNVVMKNVHDVLPHMIERRTGDIIVTSSLAAHFPTPWGTGLCVVQVGDQLLCPDGATPSVQTRHSHWLHLARPRHQRTARGLASGEAEGSEGVGKSARGKRSSERGNVHADAATRHDNSRRGHAAHQFRSLGPPDPGAISCIEQPCSCVGKLRHPTPSDCADE